MLAHKRSPRGALFVPFVRDFLFFGCFRNISKSREVVMISSESQVMAAACRENDVFQTFFRMFAKGS